FFQRGISRSQVPKLRRVAAAFAGASIGSLSVLVMTGRLSGLTQCLATPGIYAVGLRDFSPCGVATRRHDFAIHS
ncbi:MAG: hypothetical protein ACI89X_001579, partial [Planctomycetota bacterium]